MPVVAAGPEGAERPGLPVQTVTPGLTVQTVVPVASGVLRRQVTWAPGGQEDPPQVQ